MIPIYYASAPTPIDRHEWRVVVTDSAFGGRRFLYMEASNEGVDQTQEVVLAKALADQAKFYSQYGNVDIDHYTLLGKPNASMGRPGIPGCELYEIGRPLDVRQRGGTCRDC